MEKSPLRFVVALLPLIAGFVMQGFAETAIQTRPASVVAKASSGSNAASTSTVAHPAATPCTVQLFSGFAFMNYTPQYFTYTPACPGPWAKVVFSADFNITTGIQFDRTAQISIGYANIYYGTTREDTPNFGPTWHVERDLTDYSSLFNISQPGEVDLGNTVDSTYTGIIYGSAALNFYPVAAGGTAPVVADAVFPMPNGPGGAVTLNTSADQLTGTFTLPTNIETAYLDVITQSQSSDEFWYTCVPNDVTSELQSCGNTAFREAEITIDGTPAGVAPVYPWIFTGGIDPYLWLPIPGVQTLNFTPYRVDLSPFAGILSNGQQQHTIALSVFNANSYFLATASLLVYEDHGSTQVTGAVTENTLAAVPTPVATENLNTGQTGNITGSVAVTSNRSAAISGYVNTSHGTMTTAINQSIAFNNTQNFNINASKYVQAITQNSSVTSITTTTSGGVTVVEQSDLIYPLTLSINEVVQGNGNINLTTKVNQEYKLGTKELVNGATSGGSENTDVFMGTDTLILNSGFSIIGNQDQRSSKTATSMTPSGCTQTVEKAAEDHVLSTTTGPCPAN